MITPFSQDNRMRQFAIPQGASSRMMIGYFKSFLPCLLSLSWTVVEYPVCPQRDEWINSRKIITDVELKVIAGPR